MKTPIHTLNLARAALAALTVIAAPATYAATVLTPTPTPSGDLFVGFRQASATNDLVVDLGPVTNFIPSALAGYGGSWNGTPFNITFGVIPGTATPVTDLSADLANTFGANWALNPGDGTGVTWAVVGFTSHTTNNSPISGLNKDSSFLTKAETTPGTQSDILSISTGTLPTVATHLGNIENGSFGYANSTSTTNSSVAVSQLIAGNSNSWSAQFGNISSALGTSRDFEQAPNGAFSGPTDSELDLYLAPGTGSSLGTTVKYLGSFSLNSQGVLTYGTVPEPGSGLLLALAATMLAVSRRPGRSVLPRLQAPTH